MVRPSSLKRNRLPSDTPPKPHPKPAVGKKPAVLAPKPAQKLKKEEEAKPEEKVEEKQDTKDVKIDKEEKNSEKVNIPNNEEKIKEETKEEKQEKDENGKSGIKKDELDGDEGDDTEIAVKTEKEQNKEKDKKEDGSPFVRQEMPQRPRSLERSKSYDAQPVSPVEIAPKGRSSTLPRPWAPTQPVNSIRKLSLELSTGDGKKADNEKEGTKGKKEKNEDGEHEAVQDDKTEEKEDETTQDGKGVREEGFLEKPTTKLE